MRIGIFGGTFDPIHYGHLIAAEVARDELGLDRVLFVPAAVSPHKIEGAPALAEHRVRMVELALSGNPAFVLSTVDVARPGPSYTVDTVALLRQEYPDADLYFILGADALAGIATWKEPARLLQLTRLVVLNRPGYAAGARALPRMVAGAPDRVVWVEMPGIGISGTSLRARVAAHRSIRYQVPEAVEQYVRRHGLYRPRAEGRKTNDEGRKPRDERQKTNDE